jgi:hypothetical protein
MRMGLAQMVQSSAEELLHLLNALVSTGGLRSLLASHLGDAP